MSKITRHFKPLVGPIILCFSFLQARTSYTRTYWIVLNVKTQTTMMIESIWHWRDVDIYNDFIACLFGFSSSFAYLNIQYARQFVVVAVLLKSVAQENTT